MMNQSLILTLFLLPAAVLAAGESPYAGQERRAIKSLSAGDIEALRRGDGMGYAKVAELNQYPGPKHVLELAGALDLSAEQLDQTEQLFADMQAAAVDLGERLVAAEAELDGLFAEQSVDDHSLAAQLDVIAKLEAKLRFVHLEAHLRQRQILDEHQVTHYVSLRGYSRHDGEHGGHH